MKRQGLHLTASIAELVRFFALMLLSGNIGLVADDGGASRMVRYLAAPQLLFAAGFFFLWLDAGRYGAYRPLLAVGKVVAFAAFIPFIAFIGYSLAEPALGVRDPRASLAESLFIALTDLGSLAILVFCRGARPVVDSSPMGAAGSGGPALPERGTAGPESSTSAGQGPDDIERIEV